MRLEIVIESKHCALVKGYGARNLLTELRGRPPVWATLSRAWVTTEDTARDLLAVAERRGYQVALSEVVAVRSPRSVADDDVPAESGGDAPDPGRGLW